MHAKKVSKDFEIKNVGECHYLCLKSDTLLLTDVKTLGKFAQKFII